MLSAPPESGDLQREDGSRSENSGSIQVRLGAGFSPR